MWKTMWSIAVGSLGAFLSLFMLVHESDANGGEFLNSDGISTPTVARSGLFATYRAGLHGGKSTMLPPPQNDQYGFNEAAHNQRLRFNIARLTLIAGVSPDPSSGGNDER